MRRNAHGLERLVRELLRPRRQRRLPRPEISGERALLVDQLERALRVVDGRFDLAAMADDAGILQQALHVAGAETGDRRRIEILEGLAEVVTFAKDRYPAEPRLEALEADLFE